MNHDISFDGIAQQFEQEIYQSSKGYIRWQVLWHDLLTALPHLKEGGLRILDAGGGSGRMSVALAKLGHHLTLCEASQEMIAQARTLAIQESVDKHIAFIQMPLQEYSAEPFDVILNHAVLEWLAKPNEALEHLATQLKTGGYLSLMFHNRNAAIFKQTLEGKFSLALEDSSSSLLSSWNSPTRPLDPHTVQNWLIEARLQILSRAGIRIFHDYLPHEKRQGDDLEQLLQVELHLRKQEPFASLAQHVHFVCQK